MSSSEDAEMAALLAMKEELRRQLLELGGDDGELDADLLAQLGGTESKTEDASYPDEPSADSIKLATEDEDVTRSSENVSGDGTLFNGTTVSDESEEEVESSAESDDSSGEDQDEDADFDVHEMLEKCVPEPRSLPPPREKRVLQYRGADHFDVLPDGWVEITHDSGLPVYLHKKSRCCTFSRPYFIGPTSTRHHSVPESAIPCLHQRRVLEEIRKMQALEEAGESSRDTADISDPMSGGSPMQSAIASAETDPEEKKRTELLNKLKLPVTKLKTAEDMKRSNLTPEQLFEYASSTFKFRNVRTKRFPKWSQLREHKRRKHEQLAEALGEVAETDGSRPGLPRNLRLITVPVFDNAAKPQQKTFCLNPQGKTSISILHEYTQKVLKSSVKYEYLESSNCASPFHCIAKVRTTKSASDVLSNASFKEKLQHLQAVHRSDVGTSSAANNHQEDYCVLGEALAGSKKMAKALAAKKALDLLVPGLEFDEDGLAITAEKSDNGKDADQSFEIFDLLPIGDTRIPDLCSRAGQPSPYHILQECLKMNAVFGDTEITTNTQRLSHQRHQFELRVGRHVVKVIATNKHEGKQRASQAMLKELHPEIDMWGPILRLYGHEAQKRLKDVRKAQDSVTRLQGQQRPNDSLQPNMAILTKLRSEMKKLAEKLSDGSRPPMKRMRRVGDSDEPVLDEEEAIRRSREYAEQHKNGSFPHIRL